MYLVGFYYTKKFFLFKSISKSLQTFLISPMCLLQVPTRGLSLMTSSQYQPMRITNYEATRQAVLDITELLYPYHVQICFDTSKNCNIINMSHNHHGYTHQRPSFLNIKPHMFRYMNHSCSQEYVINLIERTNKMQPCSRIYYSNVFNGSTCFGRHTAHHQELKNCDG